VEPAALRLAVLVREDARLAEPAATLPMPVTLLEPVIVEDPEGVLELEVLVVLVDVSLEPNDLDGVLVGVSVEVRELVGVAVEVDELECVGELVLEPVGVDDPVDVDVEVAVCVLELVEVPVPVLELVEVPVPVLVELRVDDPVDEEVEVAEGVMVFDGVGIIVDRMKLPPAVNVPMAPARYTVPSLSSNASSHVDERMSSVPALVVV